MCELSKDGSCQEDEGFDLVGGEKLSGGIGVSEGIFAHKMVREDPDPSFKNEQVFPSITQSEAGHVSTSME